MMVFSIQTEPKSERGEAILWQKETKKLKYRERGKKREREGEIK